MPKRNRNKRQHPNIPFEHGARILSSVQVDSYNLRISDKDGFIGDNANKAAFLEKVAHWRKQIDGHTAEKHLHKASSDISKTGIEKILEGEDELAQAIVWSAIHDFAADLSDVIDRFLKEKNWAKTERIAVGGGLSESAAGRLAIAEAMLRLNSLGTEIDLVPIEYPADEAGLIGAVHLVPAWVLKGHDAIVGVDIGGTNIRAGIVAWETKKKGTLVSKAKVWKMDLWRHGDEVPSRSKATKRLAKMIKNLLEDAKEADIRVAPIIGIACPGIIESDGSIAAGGQNLPGDWESKSFNLAHEITSSIPSIQGKDTFVVIHNDAVVQGLSQVPLMGDVHRWGILTIGTGLGNARFTRNP
ncbi:ROK family protein [Phyllobacterium sp. K27]